MTPLKFLPILSIALLLVGCAALQNLTVDDVRQDKFLMVTKTYDLTLKQIVENLYQYDTKCTPLQSSIRIDPSNPNIGILTSNSMGLNSLSIVTVVDFKQDGNKTLVRGYKYTLPLFTPLDNMIWAIEIGRAHV